jgi:hypothetical protein
LKAEAQSRDKNEKMSVMMMRLKCYELKLTALKSGASREGNLSFVLCPFLPAGGQGPHPEGWDLRGTCRSKPVYRVFANQKPIQLKVTIITIGPKKPLWFSFPATQFYF